MLHSKMLIKSKNHATVVELAPQLEQVHKIKMVDITLQQTKRNPEITVLDLMINYKIPAHFKNDCLLNNSINMIARNPIIANLPLVISE